MWDQAQRLVLMGAAAAVQAAVAVAAVVARSSVVLLIGTSRVTVV